MSDVCKVISLDAAIIVTGISKRTLWRWLAAGKIARQRKDGRGRAMLAFEDVVPLLCVAAEPADYELFIDADGGEADAQNHLALLFLESDRPDIAIYWLQLAAVQEHADAMHNLAKLYIAGAGASKSYSLGLMWLAKAAASGHAIAGQQLAALTSVARKT